jgi:hypothetical protein
VVKLAVELARPAGTEHIDFHANVSFNKLEIHFHQRSSSEMANFAPVLD